MIRGWGIEQCHHECHYDDNNNSIHVKQSSDEDHARQTEEDTEQPFIKHAGSG